MDIRFLSTFLEVVKTRHFGKAAENLYLTQSAVSARIKLLEEYFQTTLFIRHRNSIQLTQAGEKLLPFAHQLTDTLKEAKRELQLESGEYVVCAATQLASEMGFSSVLGKVHQTFPEWSVKAEVLTLDSLSRQLHERSIDIALSCEPLKSEEIVSKELLCEPLSLFACNTDDTEPTSSSFVSVERGSKVREKLFHQSPQLRDARLSTNSLGLAARSLIEEGGFAYLPTSVADSILPAASRRHIKTCDDMMATVYLNTMKAVKRPGLSELITLLTE